MDATVPLTHVAIIPDGNRRWAKKRGFGSEKKVYEKGSEITFEVIKAAFEAGIPYVSFWASSHANLLARPKALVSAIEAIYAKKFRELATDPLIHENQVKVEVCGEWREILKPTTVAAMEEAMVSTAQYTRRRLTVLVGYDGQRERGAATLALLKDRFAQTLRIEDLLEAAQLLRSYAWTGDLPDVDLIIRTGAWQDPHNSAGFLSLLTSESQMAFPEVLWPDFTAEAFNKVIADFVARERRLGR
jgi:undecaprenyl diphosphate synthase